MKYYTDVLQKYTLFKGRAGKSEFWYFMLINIGISIILSIIGSMLNFDLLSSIYSLAVLLPTLAVGSRRMHDIGKSGIFFIIPFYNIYLAIQDSEQGENQYGAQPLT